MYESALSSSLNQKCFRKTVAEKTKIIFSLTNFFRELFILWDNVEKYSTARQAKADNIIRRMHFACRITTAAHTI